MTTPDDWRRSASLILILALVPGLAAPAPESTPSALEAAPSGWVDLVAQAGSELKGWSRVPIPKDSPLKETLQWKADPGQGIIVCEGNGGHEWLRWDDPQSDFVYHVDWRFTPVSGNKKKNYNSGIYARNSADGAVWHQAQTGDGSGGYIFGDTLAAGKTHRVNLSKGKDLLDKRVKPAGEWNTFEITCKGKTMTLWVNGAVTNRWDDCETPTGYVGLEAEGFRIEFRNVKLKKL